MLSVGGDGLPTAWGTTVPPAPSLACLQRTALDERGNGVVRGMGEPRGDRKTLAALAEQSGEREGEHGACPLLTPSPGLQQIGPSRFLNIFFS